MAERLDAHRYLGPPCSVVHHQFLAMSSGKDSARAQPLLPREVIAIVSRLKAGTIPKRKSLLRRNDIDHLRRYSSH